MAQEDQTKSAGFGDLLAELQGDDRQVQGPESRPTPSADSPAAEAAEVNESLDEDNLPSEEEEPS